MQEDMGGNQGFRSPGGFVFGVQGWMWGPPKPTCITFFIDNTAKVSDQYGRPIRGAVGVDNKEVYFAITAPPDRKDNPNPKDRKHLATHAQVIEALLNEKVDWQTLTYAGFPQLTYGELKKLKQLPPTPVDELLFIPNPALRRDAVRIRRELNEAIDKEREEAGLFPEE